MVAVKNRSFLGNIKANVNKNLFKTVGLGVTGAVLYPLVPIVLQSITKNDWSGGYKCLFTGVSAATFIGLAIGRPEITVGAVENSPVRRFLE